MLYQDNSSKNASHDSEPEVKKYISTDNYSGFNLQKELAILEQTIDEGVQVPLTDLVIVDGAIILDKLESFKQKLPTALAISIEILQQKQAIIQQANNQAQQILAHAKAEAEKFLDSSTLLRQTELEASRIKFETERECEQLRQATYKEIEQWREMATQEYESIQKDADNYAKATLSDLEAQLTQMLAIVHNGCEHLEPDQHSSETLVNK
jgi:cell division septum initiation protein DivIVA